MNHFAGMHQRILGITGGIAMGKTTVANYLASAYQFPVLDADIYAREAVQPGSTVLAKTVERYGLKVLLPDQTLDRRYLGTIIFSNPQERLWLERQIHPYVRQRLQSKLTSLDQHPVVVMVIPLLFEAEMTDLVTEIWVVRSNRAEQLQRLMQRNHLTLEQARARVASQMPIEQKVAKATVVLDNLSTTEALLKQVDIALEQSSQP